MAFTPVFIHRFFFLGHIHSQTACQQVEINGMTIKFGTIDTGKFCLSANCHTAGATHSRRIHHNGIQADRCLDAVILCYCSHGFHHRNWADCKDFIDLFPGLNHILQGIADETMNTVTPVIGRYDQIITDTSRFIFQDQQILAPRTDNGGDLGALFFQGRGNGIDNTYPDASADADGIFNAFNVGRPAQGSLADPSVHHPPSLQPAWPLSCPPLER